MKKMRNSKRGFTLTEIIVVIAIIVIVASAAFVGIAVVIDNAKENEKKGWRDEHGRELFEVEAWKEVDALTKDAARFFDVTKYKPATPSNTPTPTPSPTPTTAPSSGGATSTPLPTKADDNTPTPLPTATPEPTEIPKDPTPKVSDKTVVSTSNTTNAAGSNTVIDADWGSSGHGRMTFDKNVTSVTLYVPNGVELGKAWNDGISDPAKSVNGNYVTFTLASGQSIKNIKYEIKKMDNSNKNGIKVYSYTTA